MRPVFGLGNKLHRPIYYDIATHMKTTIDLPDRLLAEAKKVALRKKTTLRELLAQGLRRILEEQQRSEKFRLRKATFRGQGLQSGARDLHWDRIRDLVYDGRGA